MHTNQRFNWSNKNLERQLSFQQNANTGGKKPTHLLKEDWLLFLIWLRTIIKEPLNKKKKLVDIIQHERYKTFSRWFWVCGFPSCDSHHTDTSNLQASSSLSASVASAVEGLYLLLAAHPQASSIECLLDAKTDLCHSLSEVNFCTVLMLQHYLISTHLYFRATSWNFGDVTHDILSSYGLSSTTFTTMKKGIQKCTC